MLRTIRPHPVADFESARSGRERKTEEEYKTSASLAFTSFFVLFVHSPPPRILGPRIYKKT